MKGIKGSLMEEPTTVQYGRSSAYDIHYHLVWTTKYRFKGLNSEEQTFTKNLIVVLAERFELTIDSLEVMENHVHLLFSAKPKYAITDIVKNLKGNTARALFKQYPDMATRIPDKHLWAHSYYISTVGHTDTTTVHDYIESQWKRDDR